jgi:hypothetical protein
MKGSDPSPPNGNGSRQAAGPKKESNDKQRIQDPDLDCNRKLIKREYVFNLHEVMERRRRVHYEITDGTRTWSFPLLWSAFLKFDRLVAAHKRSAQP